MIKTSLKQEAAAEAAARSALNGLRDAAKAWEADGRDAWAELKRRDRRRLEKNDVIQIARHLHTEIESLKPRLRAQNVSLAQFCREAGLGDEETYSRRLYRVTLPPDGDVEKRELRAVAKIYQRLIDAIAKRSRESVTVVAERVLRGTSLHPMEATALDELEQIQILLQEMVDQVDEEFGLFSKFVETAMRRARHAKDGGSMRWPRYDLDITLGPNPDPEEVRAELEGAVNPAFAFWPSDVFEYYRDATSWWPIATKSMAVQDDDFFFVPHAHFGPLVLTTERKGDPHRAAVLAQEVGWTRRLHGPAIGWTPKDDWDTDNNCPRGQTLPRDWAWQCHAWIVIYPSPDGRRLMPMLYMPSIFDGPFLLPLDTKHLRYVRDHGVWVGPDQTMGAIDRLKLLITSAGDPAALDALRRTAPWFDHNPFLAAKAKEEADGKLLNEQIRKMYGRKHGEVKA